ncbi:MAG: DUF1905 domain-containing protein [Mucilaginibacter polytrichastri]|nr:DUF1905 domain-containing protein [Mucilaginibacter polytrichastri]
MTDFTTVLLQFEEQAEKTGWTYIEIPQDMAEMIKPGVKTGYRVRGKIDQMVIAGVSMLPMGAGTFIIPVKATMRRLLGKRKGAPVHVQIEEDKDFRYEMPEELDELLENDNESRTYFFSLTPSHRNYFLKWFYDAKTAPTKLDRLTRIYDALQKKWDYGLMIRRGKPRPEE